MNKILKTLLAVLGGIDTFVYIFTPFILVLLFIKVFSISGWRESCFWWVGFLSILFRGIKIGVLKGEW